VRVEPGFQGLGLGDGDGVGQPGVAQARADELTGVGDGERECAQAAGEDDVAQAEHGDGETQRGACGEGLAVEHEREEDDAGGACCDQQREHGHGPANAQSSQAGGQEGQEWCGGDPDEEGRGAYLAEHGRVAHAQRSLDVDLGRERRQEVERDAEEKQPVERAR
jgi:hypothetical protein